MQCFTAEDSDVHMKGTVQALEGSACLSACVSVRVQYI